MVQDDFREDLIRELFGLSKPAGQNERIGADGVDELDFEYELKSTTIGSISAARAVQLRHFEKWRRRIWICASGVQISRNDFQIDEIRVLFSHNLEPWFSKEESKIKSDISLMNALVDHAPPELASNKRLQLLCDRAVRPSGALSFTWGYAQKHGHLIQYDHAKELRRLVAHENKEAFYRRLLNKVLTFRGSRMECVREVKKLTHDMWNDEKCEFFIDRILKAAA